MGTDVGYSDIPEGFSTQPFEDIPEGFALSPQQVSGEVPIPPDVPKVIDDPNFEQAQEELGGFSKAQLRGEVPLPPEDELTVSQQRDIKQVAARLLTRPDRAPKLYKNWQFRLTDTAERNLARLGTWLFPTTGDIRGTGAMTGALIGSAVGTTPQGMLAKGVLGAALGRMGAGQATGETIEESALGAMDEARSEALWGGGVAVGVKAIAHMGQGLAKIALAADAKDLAKAARDLDLKETGIISLSNTQSPGFSRFFTQVFAALPLIGGGIKKQHLRAQIEIENKLHSEVLAVAPFTDVAAAGVDFGEVSKRLVGAAQETYKAFRNEVKDHYDRYFQKAWAMEKAFPGVTKQIPTSIIKTRINEIEKFEKLPKLIERQIQNIEHMDWTGLTGLQREQKIKEIRKDFPVLESKVVKFVENLKKLEDKITPLELRGLQRQVTDLFREGTQMGFDFALLTQLKRSMDHMQAAIPVPELLADIRAANTFFSQGIKKFQTASAKEFLKVDRRFFSPTELQEMGPKVADAIAETFSSTRTPQKIKDLRRLVGAERVHELARVHIQNALESPQAHKVVHGIDVYNFEGVERALQLHKSVSTKGAPALEEMLKGTNLDVDRLRKFVEVGKRYGNIAIADASTLLRRRLALGGTLKVGTGAVFGARMSGESLKGVIAFMTLRGSAWILSSPKALKWATIGMDDTVDLAKRNIAFGNLMFSLSAAIRNSNDDALELEKETNKWIE